MGETIVTVILGIIAMVIAVVCMLAFKKASLFVSGLSVIFLVMVPIEIVSEMRAKSVGLTGVENWISALVTLGLSVLGLILGMVFTKMHDEEEGESFSVLVTLAVGLLTVLLAGFYLVFGLLAFFGGASGSDSSSSSSPSSYTPPQSSWEPEGKETEVYKEHIHADGSYYREKMKVNSTGDRYFDPSDGSWHKI